jgi:hypothetical protein
MIHMTMAVGPFDPVTAAGLVALTTSIGFAFGTIFALIWNMLAARAA